MVSLSSLARTAIFNDSRGVSLIPATEDTNPGWTTEAQCPTLLDLRGFDFKLYHLQIQAINWSNPP